MGEVYHTPPFSQTKKMFSTQRFFHKITKVFNESELQTDSKGTLKTATGATLRLLRGKTGLPPSFLQPF